jgi:hypothetical protein
MKLLIITSVIITVGLFITLFGILFSSKVIDEADELDNQE